MSIQDLGSLGEFIAAIATLVTLAYLAMQIRHNTRALDQTSERTFEEHASRWRENLIRHPEIAQLYRKGMLEPESLDPTETFRFRMLLDDLFYNWQYQLKSRIEYANTAGDNLSGTLATPGGAIYWAKSKHRFSTEFVEYVGEFTEGESSEV